VETNLERVIREPWNAVTAFLFVIIVLVWLWRLRGHYREHPFVLICMPILLAGGIGGTIYHALRQYYFAFLLDVIPIVLLVVVGSVYLLIRLRPRWWQVAILGCLLLLFPALFVFHVETHVAIVIHYIVLALLVLVPIAIVLVRTRFRYLNLILMTLVCFGFAILFRFLDPLSRPILPMGSHWLWHIGGALCTVFLSEYFYRLETEPIAPLPWQLTQDELKESAISKVVS
jgi:hypothetical protein